MLKSKAAVCALQSGLLQNIGMGNSADTAGPCSLLLVPQPRLLQRLGVDRSRSAKSLTGTPAEFPHVARYRLMDAHPGVDGSLARMHHLAEFDLLGDCEEWLHNEQEQEDGHIASMRHNKATCWAAMQTDPRGCLQWWGGDTRISP